MKSQVTTKRGDRGETTALSGDSWPKSHPIMECVGTVDELRANLALARLRILESNAPEKERVAEFMLWILHTLFVVGSECSDPARKHPEYLKTRIAARELDRLEAEQRWIEERTPLPHSFIVSAANIAAAQVDVACTVVRRLERNIVRLKEAVPEFDGTTILPFVNRLSDFTYMLARYLEVPTHVCVDYTLLLTT